MSNEENLVDYPEFTGNTIREAIVHLLVVEEKTDKSSIKALLPMKTIGEVTKVLFDNTKLLRVDSNGYYIGFRKGKWVE